jgi:tetratricopeptide (TPR) repeat protein
VPADRARPGPVPAARPGPHAHALTVRIDPEEDRDAAIARLLDYYQHTASAANIFIRFWSHPGQNLGGERPGAAPGLAGREQALAWARTERARLQACLDYAISGAQHTRVIALASGLSGLLLADGPVTDAVTRNVAAVQAAQHLGDQLSQDNALCDLGEGLLGTGDYPGSVHAHEQAIGIYRDLGERLGEANALNHLGFALQYMGDNPAAAPAHERALSISRDLGERLGQANALSGLANMRAMTGDLPAAVQTHEAALAMYGDLGDREGQGETYRLLGGLLRRAGDFPAAARALDEALGIFRDIDDRNGVLAALNARGHCTGSAASSRWRRNATSSPWNCPARRPVPGTRRTRWLAWVAALWPPGRPRVSCSGRCR